MSKDAVSADGNGGRPVTLEGPSFPRAYDVHREAAIRVARDRARLHLYAVDRMLEHVTTELATAACVLSEVEDTAGFMLVPASAHTLREQVRAASKELE